MQTTFWEYLKYGFVPSFANEAIPTCLLLCKKAFINGAMKPAKMNYYSERIGSDKMNKDFEYPKS